jgi:hypothetical protein
LSLREAFAGSLLGAVTESFGLLLTGTRMLSHPQLQQYFGLADRLQLQTVMFLQVVVGSHLLLFVTGTQCWFFLPPFSAEPLAVAILLTQICGGADVRLRLAGSVDHLVADRMGVGLQHRLDCCTRRRSSAYEAYHRSADREYPLLRRVSEVSG